jgi:predicted RND superfamily exporter protein
MIIPAGDNDSEKEIVSEVKDLRHTLSVTGLSDIDAIGDYKLLDEVTPRQFAELLDIDIEVAELAYGSYALEHNEYGKAITGMDSYRIALLDIFDYLLESREDVTLNLDQETQDKIDEMKEELDDGKLQLLSDDWSRIVIDSDVPYEETESYEYLSALRGIVARYYDESYIIGDTTSCSDLKSSFENDNTVITILEIVFVTLILIFTFHSVGLPLLLIVVIQGSILINFSSPFLHNKNLFFLTYLIISAIQMGANIDYAIVISDRYLESRRYMEPKEAITDALNKAFPTIVTSGTMMAAAGVVIALVASNETISAIGVYLGKGTLISIFLVTCVLPQILLLGDGVISKTSFTTQIGTMFSHAGSVRLDGHVRGYVSGFIDAEVRGRFNGEVNVHMDIDTTASEESPEGLSTPGEEAKEP